MHDCWIFSPDSPGSTVLVGTACFASTQQPVPELQRNWQRLVMLYVLRVELSAGVPESREHPVQAEGPIEQQPYSQQSSYKFSINLGDLLPVEAATAGHFPPPRLCTVLTYYCRQPLRVYFDKTV
jgi:hypothetical protein